MLVTDGIVRSVAYAPPVPTASETEPDTPRTPAKSVIFIPLSPKSSATLRRHHEKQATRSEDGDAASESDGNNRGRGKGLVDDDDDDDEPARPRRRRDSDPSSNRPLVSRRRPRDAKSATSDDDDDDEEVIEMLPDRFDAQGRPLDGSASTPLSSRGGPQWHSRRGDFEYRSPRGASGTNMRGEWGIAGTDAEAVERIVKNVTGVLEGRGSWMGLISGILSGSLLQGGGGGGNDGEGQGRITDRDRDRDRSRHDRDEDRRRRRRDDDDDDDDDRGESGRRRRKDEEKRESGRRWRGDERGESSRHAEDRRTRGRERDGYYDDDDDDRYDEDRKRRRRRGDDPYERGVGRSQTWG